MRAPALLVLALLVGACGGGQGTIDGRDARRLVLQPGDVGARFVRFDEGRQLRADLAPPREDPGRFGRTAGWKARFRAGDPALRSGPAVVESMVDVFGDADGARRDLEAYRATVRARTGRSLSVPRIGDTTFAWSQQPGGASLPRFFTLAWRSRNATASLTVSGFDLRLEDVVALARKQQAHVDRAAG